MKLFAKSFQRENSSKLRIKSYKNRTVQFSCTKSQICNGGYFKFVSRLLSPGSITELAQDYGNSNEDCVAP